MVNGHALYTVNVRPRAEPMKARRTADLIIVGGLREAENLSYDDVPSLDPGVLYS